MKKYFFIASCLFTANLCNATELKEALVSVYQNNPTLLSAREALKIEAEKTSEAVSQFMPKANITTNYTRAKTPRSSNGGNSRTKSFGITQNLFNGGSDLFGLKIAKKQFEAGLQTLKSNEQQILLNAIKAYMDVIRTQEALEINNNNVEVNTKTLNSTEERYNLGELTRTDVAKARAELAKAVSQKISAEGEHMNARADYKNLFGDEANKLIFPNEPESLPATLEELINRSSSNFPAIIRAKLNTELYNSQILQKAGNLLPEVNLSAGSTHNNGKNKGPSGFDNQFRTTHSKSHQKQVAIAVNIPLYQGGSEYSAVRQSKINLQKAKSDSQSTVNDVIKNSVSSWQAYETAKAKYLTSTEQVDAATIAYEGSSQQFEVGTNTLLDVLTAQQELLTAKLQLTQSKSDKVFYAYQLFAMTGNLTAQDLKLPTTYYDPYKYYNLAKFRLIGF
jgi:TolC family type I secretion outer membrane protein